MLVICVVCKLTSSLLITVSTFIGELSRKLTHFCIALWWVYLEWERLPYQYCTMRNFCWI